MSEHTADREGADRGGANRGGANRGGANASRTSVAAWVDVLWRHPFLLFFAVVAVQTLPALGRRDLWYMDEVRHGAVLREMLERGNWFVLTLDGADYPDKPPLWFWLLGGLSELAGGAEPWVFSLALALSALAFVYATYLLCRRTVGHDAAVTAGIVLLATLYIAGMMHYRRMDLLFAALIALSHLFLFLGLNGPKGDWRTLAGFLFAGLAVLTKGPLGIALPLVGAVAFLAVTRRPGRLFSWDVGAGLLATAAVPGAWLLAAGTFAGWDFVAHLLRTHVLQRAVGDWEHSKPFWFYLVLMPVFWLPWTALPAFASVRRAIGGGLAAWVRRGGPADAGPAYLGAAFLAGFLLLDLLSGKSHIYLMPLWPPLAGLTALGLHRLGDAETRRFLRLAAVFAGVLALAVATEAAFGFARAALGVAIDGLPLLAAIAWASAMALHLVRRRPLRQGLLVLLTGTSLAVVQLSVTVAPSLDAAFSPRPLASELRELADEGYHPVMFRIYPGTFTYHFGAPLEDIATPAELRARWQRHGRVAVIMDADTFADRSADFPLRRIAEGRVERPMVLSVLEPPDGGGGGDAPAESPR
jgi:4-amino-4-deoxy-L-arabinose transferase-like glycosyltransferase